MKINHAIILAFLSLCSVLSKGQGTFSIMTYNIENAFDTIHDEGKNDYEYLIGGERNWNTYRLLKKLRSVSKVIAAANEDRPVDLIGLCEVENENVMECLTKQTPLRNMGYRYVMTSSEDARGIDVALLYSPYTFHIIEHESIYVSSDKKKTRDILHATGTIMSGDTHRCLCGAFAIKARWHCFKTAEHARHKHIDGKYRFNMSQAHASQHHSDGRL